MQPKKWPAFLRSPRFWITAVVVLASVALLYRLLDLETVRAKAAELNGALVFLLLTVLPLIGFPVSVLQVAAGMRFGIPLGLALVWLSIFLQLLASYALVRWRKEFFNRRFKKLRAKIPKGAHRPVTVFTMLIPGAPYAAQNYILPVIGVPLRTYIGICLPMHAARSCVAVILGGQSHDFTPGRVLLLLVYVAAILTASWWALRRMRSKLEGRPPVASGRKRPA